MALIFNEFISEAWPFENLKIFKSSGYELEDFGIGNILVRSIPMYIDISSTKDFIIEITFFTGEWGYANSDLEPEMEFHWLGHKQRPPYFK